jgi:hypothetical protein
MSPSETECGVAQHPGLRCAPSRLRSLALLMRFHEPQPLVDAARDFGQDILGDGVLEIVHLLDAEPDGACERGERRLKRIHVLIATFQH